MADKESEEKLYHPSPAEIKAIEEGLKSLEEGPTSTWDEVMVKARMKGEEWEKRKKSKPKTA
jgi:hypothetical protein